MKNGSATSDAIEKAALELARLRKDFTDAIAFLPPYDQRQVDKVRSTVVCGIIMSWDD